MKIVTAAEMRETDRLTSERAAVASLTLMENAGTAVAETAMQHSGSVLVVCGKGSNGGDGLVAARKLHEAGREVSVVLLAQPPDVKGDAAEMLRKLPFKPTVATTVERLRSTISEADVIIDAILGTGFTPPVSELYAAAIAAINSTQARVIAVDLPSGAESDARITENTPHCRAHEIVTFTGLKPAHLWSFPHIPTTVAPIGTPDGLIQTTAGYEAITAADFKSLLASRDVGGHKGDYGHVLIIGGSVGKAGAAAMAGMAALRSGAGLVTVACPSSVLRTVAGFAAELMTEPLAETATGSISISALRKVLELSRIRDIVAVGPGLSRDLETQRFVQSLVAQCEKPLILDADALNAFDGGAEVFKDARVPLVITPHPGEMSRLTGKPTAEIQANRVVVAKEFASTHSVTTVLKGKNTVVALPSGAAYINPTGNPGMATGGTGDILTGVIAGFSAQHPERMREVVIGSVFLHGLAGDFAAADLGEISMTATDLLGRIPRAIRHVQSLPPARIW